MPDTRPAFRQLSPAFLFLSCFSDDHLDYLLDVTQVQLFRVSILTTQVRPNSKARDWSRNKCTIHHLNLLSCFGKQRIPTMEPDASLNASATVSTPSTPTQQQPKLFTTTRSPFSLQPAPVGRTQANPLSTGHVTSSRASPTASPTASPRAHCREARLGLPL
ncbi:hypothetical protein BT69DRAFT_778169 [Atractiella rhizophila]|nr:hypothetical protein BT69DRAFT_778169 [Atractiella rhizophila]